LLFPIYCPASSQPRWLLYDNGVFMDAIQVNKTQTSSGESRAHRRILSLRQLAPLVTVFVFVSLWQLVVSLALYPSFIIPSPLSVLEKAVEVIQNGTLWLHTTATFINVLLGLLLGLGLGVSLGYWLGKSPLLEDLLSPLIVAVQSTPVVAYAPLLVIWFGSGPSSKIVTGALIVFFPMLINTIVGVHNVPSGLQDVMRTMQASRWQTFIKLEVPAAMPVLMSGLKISATLAVIGAVVGEFISANVGLGFLVNLARSQYDTPLVIVAVLTLTIMARSLFALASLLERSLLVWQNRVRHD
jgi:NitT/TauT family transport system permease protein